MMDDKAVLVDTNVLLATRPVEVNGLGLSREDAWPTSARFVSPPSSK
jgi:hypothetical protein